MLIDVIKESREIFGKREIEIVDKQINGITLTQTEKNVLSRSIRKKLELVKKLSKYSDEFNLKFNAGNTKIIDESINTIKSRINPKAILLFGSLQKRDNTKFSDIDLCIVLGRNVSKKEATEILLEISGRLNNKIDISIYENLPDKVKYEILTNNRILYKTEGFSKKYFEIKELKLKDDKKYF